MKKQILSEQIKRMQFLAGIISEDQSKVPSELTEWQDIRNSEPDDSQPTLNIPGHGDVKYKVENKKVYLIVSSSSLYKNSKKEFEYTTDSKDKEQTKTFLNDVAHQTARDISKLLSNIGIKNEIQSVDDRYTPGIDSLEVVFGRNYLSVAKSKFKSGV
jgi:predicted type IV restriction endonuclease